MTVVKTDKKCMEYSRLEMAVSSCLCLSHRGPQCNGSPVMVDTALTNGGQSVSHEILSLANCCYLGLPASWKVASGQGPIRPPG